MMGGKEGKGNREQETGSRNGSRVQEAGFRVQVLPRGKDLERWAVPEP
jgi:hypothetical protein